MLNGKIRIYAAGGCGTNLVSAFAGIDSNEEMYAEIMPTFIDTSRSNLDPSITHDQCFILPDMDGSGKIRSENHKEISSVIKKIVLEYPPETFNIVVFSGSGGSGSVIAPLIIKELLERGETVVGIMVSSSESKITCVNTINTLKSLDHISSITDSPVVIDIEHNEPGVRRSEIDTRVHKTISALASLCSPNNHGLDSRDLSTWINYHRGCEVEPQLSQLTVCFDRDELDEITNPISQACLFNDRDTEVPQNFASYMTDGHRKKVTGDVPDLYCVINTDFLADIQKHLNSEISRYEELSRSRDNSRRKFVADDDAITDDGLIL